MTRSKIAEVLLAADLTPTEKLIAFVILAHSSVKEGKARLRQSRIAEEAGVSIRTVSRAINALSTAGIIEPKSTGRSSIFIFCHEEQILVGTPSVTCLQRHSRRTAPWKYDTEFSSTPEEEHKRYEAQEEEDGSDLR